MTAEQPQLIPVGRIGAVHGVRGWVRIQSFTAPPEKIFDYQPWWLKTSQGYEPIEVLDSAVHGQKLVVRLAGVDERELAKTYAQMDIAVDAGAFPELEAGEYYWHQLEGLRVISDYQGKRYDLGRIDRLMETGANDVLVVRGGTDSVDRGERLLPYLPGQTVKHIDLAQGEMIVDWDPEF